MGSIHDVGSSTIGSWLTLGVCPNNNKCINFGFCEEACGVDAIVESVLENILTMDMLLSIANAYEAIIAPDKGV